MLSQILANTLIGARIGHTRRSAGAERKGSFPTGLSGIFQRKPDDLSGPMLAAPPDRDPKARRTAIYGTLFYLAGIALVGAVVVGVCFGVGLYSLAFPTDEAGWGFGATQALAVASPAGEPAAPSADPPPAAAPDSAAVPAERPASQPRVVPRFADATGEMVSGRVVEAVDAMTWVVANSTIRLWGVRPGPPGSEPLLEKLIDWARARGPVECHKHPHSSRYRCSTATGDDVAKTTLLAGVGRAAESATAVYRNAEAQARRNGKGLWSGQ